VRTPLRRRRPVLKPEQWPQLRREFHDYGPETQLLVDVAIDSGLRWGELTDLRAGQVVNRTPVYVKVETVVTWPGEQFSTSGDVVERKHYTKGAEGQRTCCSPPTGSAPSTQPGGLVATPRRVRLGRPSGRPGSPPSRVRLNASSRHCRTAGSTPVSTPAPAPTPWAAAARTAPTPTPPTSAPAGRPYVVARRPDGAGRSAGAGRSRGKGGSAPSGSAMSSGARRCSGRGWSGCTGMTCGTRTRRGCWRRAFRRAAS
jgi:hypothetical protein